MTINLMVVYFRKAFKANKIAKERIELLKSLLGWSWNTKSENINLVNS